ncbi:MAG TPA: hypothetical protein PLC15_25445 [Candidatus Obscuribacter sp.]|nr:hypothetical protein [Candidatus Obscuribacter sp.]MBK9279723.1 hypothetical protein [Candidatus Obscuribacter sp.]MBL8081722.1 hypothetical protein [Candidatus Obscuribacter sp.]HMX47805.1 hypothetical protein [Candidatus Obscuribacter sp.]HNB18756.1 hypothetical protein [Candidatus Obscuribacter sp.]
MKANLILSLTAMAVVSVAGAQSASADNKVVDGAKAVGRGIMWAPKKICSGLGKGCKAIGNGMKKMVGK